MALIACEECGREISSRAAACPHCGCPTPQIEAVEVAAAEPRHPERVPEVKVNVAMPDRIPELNVNVAMPPGLGTATVSAIKDAAASKAWGRLYLTLRAIAIVWLVGLGIGAVFLYNTEETRARARLREVLPESGLVQITSYGLIDSVPEKEARESLQSRSYRLATAEEVELETKRRRDELESEPLLAGAAMLGAGLAPLAILVALNRLWGWLRAPSR